MPELCQKEDEIFQLVASRTNHGRHLHLHDFITELTQELGLEQAFYLYDLADILWKAQLWKELFPNVDPYYAIKVSSDPVIVRLMVLLGFGFDCSTKGEMEVVLRAGGDPHRIVFAHTVKPSSTLGWARQKGVDLLTVDCEEELHKVATHFPDARLILRLKSSNVGNHTNVYDLSKKFGCDFSEAELLLIKGKELNLNIIGTSFHVGALCEDVETYLSTILNCRSVFDTAKKLGFHFTILDIGAGFHGTHEKEDHFVKLSHEIQRCISDNFSDPELRIIAEPGTYFLGSAGTLTTAVLGKKRVPQKVAEQTGIQMEYFLNEGVYGSFFREYFLYGPQMNPLLPEAELKKRAVLRSVIWGQTCCSEDVISEGCSIPEMKADEFIVWTNMGAYHQMMCTTFTGVLLPATRHVFINTKRLKSSGIKNFEDVINLIAEKAVLVETTSPVLNGNC